MLSIVMSPYLFDWTEWYFFDVFIFSTHFCIFFYVNSEDRDAASLFDEQNERVKFGLKVTKYFVFNHSYGLVKANWSVPISSKWPQMVISAIIKNNNYCW